jgi:hypothetical protein
MRIVAALSLLLVVAVAVVVQPRVDRTDYADLRFLRDDAAGSATTASERQDTSAVPLPPYRRMKFAVWRIDRPFQSYYGPAGKGYAGTGYFADDAMPGAQATWDDINRAGYTAKWMAVRRDWLAASPVDWKLVDAEINFAVVNKVDFISIDDPLSPYSYHGALIRDETMLAFGHRVHLRGKKVAAADNDNIQDLLAKHPHFFDSVDVFMPYGYNRTLEQLREYFSWVRARFPEKAIVPILGYHVRDVSPPYHFLPHQLGAESGHTGYIEMAQSFAAANADPRTRMILYYYEPDPPWPLAFEATGGLRTYLDSLTSYLVRYNYVRSSH